MTACACSPTTLPTIRCDLCRSNLQTSCPHGGFFSEAQAEAIRVPLADGTLVKLPIGADDALLPALLTLADVYGTGHHAAVRAGVKPGDTVTVIGDGAVGLLAVLSAKRLGAEQIILMGRHRDRTDLGREFGATDIVAERGAEGIERIRELTGGRGTDSALEAVGHLDAYETALATVRPGGVISRVGVPQYEQGPIGFGAMFGGNLTLTGGPAPVRAYIEELLPDILDGTVQPGRVFDRTTDLAGVPDGYRAMNDRKALKVLITP
ncbi:zinc-binding dehydrogenase [Nocardia fusca]|uniref:Zinc-binding dehydrogenase n=1 Tax=Nocardia fusca TaxID=941183 RepID=A0ABV3F1F5_9NOCA